MSLPADRSIPRPEICTSDRGIFRPRMAQKDGMISDVLDADGTEVHVAVQEDLALGIGVGGTLKFNGCKGGAGLVPDPAGPGQKELQLTEGTAEVQPAVRGEFPDIGEVHLQLAKADRSLSAGEPVQVDAVVALAKTGGAGEALPVADAGALLLIKILPAHMVDGEVGLFGLAEGIEQETQPQQDKNGGQQNAAVLGQVIEIGSNQGISAK